MGLWLLPPFSVPAMIFLHLERQQGESVEFSCHIEPGSPLPYGFYLKRTWLQPRIVFFWYQNDPPDVKDAADKGRLSISGDPSSHAVNVSFSQLKAADTDRYSCEFMVERNGKEDEKIPGRTEFFLYVSSDGEYHFPHVSILRAAPALCSFSIHPFSSVYPESGRRGSSLSPEAQTSLSPATWASSSGGIPRRSLAR
uniref:Ig-like domain-containing protein n=1 Tax=Nothobranchius furzeri TaxID=105023 RepID=A0A8C6MGA4_NOTFU